MRASVITVRNKPKRSSNCIPISLTQKILYNTCLAHKIPTWLFLYFLIHPRELILGAQQSHIAVHFAPVPVGTLDGTNTQRVAIVATPARVPTPLAHLEARAARGMLLIQCGAKGNMACCTTIVGADTRVATSSLVLHAAILGIVCMSSVFIAHDLVTLAALGRCTAEPLGVVIHQVGRIASVPCTLWTNGPATACALDLTIPTDLRLALAKYNVYGAVSM